jgi:hypothetical protein
MIRLCPCEFKRRNPNLPTTIEKTDVLIRALILLQKKRDLRETSPLSVVLQPTRQPLQKASASIVLMIRIISSESWNGN